MTYNPGKTPPYVLPVEQSDYEQALTPNRSVTNTQSLVAALPKLQQGTPALQSQPSLAGVPGYAIVRWW